MTEQYALYRKYRPQAFAQVVGQSHVVSLMEEAVKNGHPSHAYLFTGGRGLGKTTVARIFARELSTAPIDIYEIDAASNRGIDDIRDLREAVKTFPMESKYKVYIIDEVHMLTKDAFNALLKTLEEPPAHAIFILATTEFDKVIETIRSRCTILHFRQPDNIVLEKYIADIAKAEGIKITDGAIKLLTLLADRSYRDACVRLEESIRHSAGETINEDIVASISGAPNSQIIHDLVEVFAFADKKSAESAVGEIGKENMNHELLITMLLARLRAVIMLRHKLTNIDAIVTKFGKDEAEYLDSVAKKKENLLNSATIIKLIDALHMTRRSPVKSLPLELAIIDSLDK